MKDIEIIRPQDHVVAYTIGAGNLKHAAIETLEEYKRTVYVNHTRGLLYFSAAMMLMDEKVGAKLADKAGEHVAVWKGHYYVPAGWLVTIARPEQRDSIRRMFQKFYRGIFPDAIEVPEYISPLGLRSAGAVQ